MLLVRIRTLTLFFIVSFCGTLSSAIFAYGIGMEAGYKGDAEDILFFGLAIFVVQLICGIALLHAARKSQRELDTLAELVRNGGSIDPHRLERFGSLGARLRYILQELSDASDRKGARIASLSSLLNSVLDLVDRPIFIISLDGRIIARAAGFREDSRFKELPQKTTLSELVPDVDLSSVLREADRTHTPVERPGPSVFMPIFSTRGEISHFLVDLSKKSAVEFLATLTKDSLSRIGRDSPSRVSGAKRGFFGIFQRRSSRHPSPKDTES